MKPSTHDEETASLVNLTDAEDVEVDDTARPGVLAVLDSMVRSQDTQEKSFASLLRREMSTRTEPETTGADPYETTAPSEATPAVSESSPEAIPPVTEVAAEPAPEPSPPAPVSAPAAPITRLPSERTDLRFEEHANLGSPRWSTEKLEAIGMPDSLLDRTRNLDPSHDLRWVHAIVEAASPACARDIGESSMIVTSRHTALADTLGLPIHRAGDLPPYGGSIFCLIDQRHAPVDLEWLARVKGDRGTVVVMEDQNSEQLFDVDVTGVAYSSPLGAALALKSALIFDVALTFGVTHEDVPIRATGFDVALSIRDWIRAT